LLGVRAQYDNHGNWYANCPILTEIVDEPLFAALKAAGLKDADACHYMYAVHNGCDRFVTTDPHFFDRRPKLQALGRGMLIQQPSDLVAELGI
jgi:predicted nucleic acid-binding protein